MSEPVGTDWTPAVRRAYPRWDIQVAVTVRLDGDGDPITGSTVNLSRSGGLVRLDSPVAADARYLVCFSPGPGAEAIELPRECPSCGGPAEAWTVPVQSVWAVVCRQGGHGHHYAAAFEFETLLELDQAA